MYSVRSVRFLIAVLSVFVDKMAALFMFGRQRYLPFALLALLLIAVPARALPVAKSALRQNRLGDGTGSRVATLRTRLEQPPARLARVARASNAANSETNVKDTPIEQEPASDPVSKILANTTATTTENDDEKKTDDEEDEKEEEEEEDVDEDTKTSDAAEAKEKDTAAEEEEAKQAAEDAEEEAAKEEASIEVASAYDQPLMIVGIVAIACLACGIPLITCFFCGCCSCFSSADDLDDIGWTTKGDSSALSRKSSAYSSRSGRQSLDCSHVLEMNRMSGGVFCSADSLSSGSMEDYEHRRPVDM